MIEDKEIGFSMTENEEESMWKEIIESSEADNKKLLKMIIFNNAVIEMANRKLIESAPKN